MECVKFRKSTLPLPTKSKSSKESESLAAFNTVVETIKKQIPEPRTISEAKNSKEWPFWKEAIDDEMKSLKENATWRLIQKSAVPKDKKCINSKWVLKVKYQADGSIERYKARLVAQGYTQSSGIDYNETFAPVVKFNSVRMILAFAASKNKKISQFDVKIAFLRGDLVETIYMRLP